MSKHSTVCAGIDTGKRKLDVALDGTPEQVQVDNTPMVTRFDGLAAAVSGEAGWHRGERRLRAGRRRRTAPQGLVVIMFQPAQVRAYANFHLQRAKNDKIDAALIASCTAAVKKIHARPIRACCHLPSV